MSLLSRKALFQTVSCMKQFKRFRGKINIQKPKPPHFERATFLALAKPYYINPNKGKLKVELCEGVDATKSKDVDNPFQRIIAQELYRWFTSSRLVVFYHLNPMSSEDQFKAYALFKKQKMHFKQYGKKTLEVAVKGTPYEVVLDFYVSQNMTVFSPEPDIKKMLNITKKFPQLILLAGIYEGRFVSKDELTGYSLIPNLQAAQAGFVQTLNSIGGQLVTQLNSHQTTLVAHLEERTRQLEEKH
ncbi:39S ribosomal protein L10, mitochondrial [Anoplophora glabripennis]|uniref:39S ribosomal protein L10, mitochondrial n=1 Tax=Anoplophora glabripennis TaxID=217634 RepID=UPI0008758E3C|nr:39S ribosomal protein L10, mitochondrial [Anoplophora glabripennis]